MAAMTEKWIVFTTDFSSETMDCVQDEGRDCMSGQKLEKSLARDL